ncbi:MAG: sigma 54-interacting transcriptional regulator [Desulfuromonadales bacterium]|nr:sigma 54-interacting transcriptional regulator [Desulfuromonadales bacterium]
MKPLNKAIETAPSRYVSRLLEAVDAGLIAVTHSGEILYANQHALKCLQRSTEHPLQVAFPELWNILAEFNPASRQPLTCSAPAEGQSYSVNINTVSEDSGRTVYICSLYAHTQIENLARQTKAFQDLSREESAIIDFSSDGLWICDANARVVRINPASERLNNVKAEEVLGKHMEEMIVEGIFDKSVTLEVIKHKKVTSLLQKRGDRALLLTGAPVFDQDGVLIRVVVSERDVTEIETLQRALEDQEALKNKYMEQALSLQKTRSGERQIIARSPEFIKVIAQSMKLSSVDSTVLILGESGVGKGLIADLIHENSKRSAKPIIRINCGAVPESLIESELFGYDKGAFTGAQTSKAGQFELADDGILFLDEVAELPLSAQVKLLRFLEDGCIYRLGSTHKRKLDVRVLAATHRDLDKMVEEGSFRLDLYYRLKVIPLQVPSLRERRDCIIPLIRHHLDYFGEKVGTQKRLSAEASDILCRYEYPGNVRELINLCERLVVMTDTSVIKTHDLPQDVINSAGGKGWTISGWSKERRLDEILSEVEERIYREAFGKYRNQYKVASVLGVSQATVARRLQKYRITGNLADTAE